MKKVLGILLALVMLLSLTACGNSSNNSDIKDSTKVTENKIPDVFGLDYNVAISVLEAEGFEVTAIATDVEFISIKLLYPFERVSKGVVFKIDDYILDNNGNLNKSYDFWREGGLTSEDKRLVIYYAQEDYERKR